MLEVKNLKKNFGDFQAVKGISFSVKEGEVLGFLDVVPVYLSHNSSSSFSFKGQWLPTYLSGYSQISLFRPQLR